ncbi:CHAT domain-containing protein [Ahniella affigens]|nr:CHAT domain-containing protein [Ahniella affigens]
MRLPAQLPKIACAVSLSLLFAATHAKAATWTVVLIPDDASTRGFTLQIGDTLPDPGPAVTDVWAWRKHERLRSIRADGAERTPTLPGRSGEWLALPHSDRPADDAGERLRLAIAAARAQDVETARQHYQWLRDQVPEQVLEVAISQAQELPALSDQAPELARIDALLATAPTGPVDDATRASWALLALLRAESALRLRDCASVPALVGRVVRDAANSVLHAEARLVSAQCQLRAREFERAKQDLDEAEAVLIERAPGSIQLAILKGRRAVWLQMQRQLDAARSAYRDALATLAALSPIHLELGRWHFNLHLMALEHRELANAEHEARLALAIFQKRQPGSLLYFQALAGVAEVLSRRAEFQQAVLLLADAVRASDQVSPWSYEALSLHVQYANALHQAGATAAARAELDTLLIRLVAPEAQRVREGTMLLADAAQYRASVAVRAGDCSAALIDTNAALAAYRERQQQGAGVLNTLLVQAECELQAKDWDRADESLSAAVATATAMHVAGVQRASLDSLQAALAAARGNPTQAAILDDQALTAFEAHRAAVGGTPLLRAQWADQYAPFYKRAMQRAADQSDFVRLDRLDRRYRFQALLALLDVPDVEAPKHWLQFLQTAANPREHLAAHQAMVRWLVLPDEILVLIDRRQAPMVVQRLPISSATLRADLERFLLLSNRALKDPASVSAQFEQAHQLFEQLLQPLAPALADSTHWILVADGPLLQVPWPALVTELTTDGPRFLIESKVLATAASSDVWLQIQRRSQQATTAVAFGDPDFGALSRLPQANGERQQLQALPGARQEASQVAERYGDRAELLLGPAATESAARAKLPNAAVAHFALHSVLDAKAPMASYIALSEVDGTGADPRQDGHLSAAEVLSEVPLQAKLVVLSSCASARGQELAGPGVLGLTSAFHAAGAASVVASLWPISDAATAILMPDLHESFAVQGQSAEALAAAQRGWLQAARDQRWWTQLSRQIGLQPELPEQPLQAYYWAAFTLSGGR